MLFPTIEFSVFFIAVITALVCYKNRKFQHVLLVVASFFFLYFSDNYLIMLLIYTTILHYFIGKKIFDSEKIKEKKIFLWIGIGGSLGLLGFFKYMDFGISQFNNLLMNLGISEIPLMNIVLPIGISFYTFQSISYIIDIYRGSLKPTNSILQYGLFVSFFPTLIAGPILRASDFLPQLNEKISEIKSKYKLKQFSINSTNLKLGITLMSIGFLKKVFFADNISPMVENVFNNPVGHETFTIILGTIGFGLQVYGDFSGYSDIAIGAALIIGAPTVFLLLAFVSALMKTNGKMGGWKNGKMVPGGGLGSVRMYQLAALIEAVPRISPNRCTVKMHQRPTL